MNRTRKAILLGFLALALSAVASTSASAAECKAEGLPIKLCTYNHETSKWIQNESLAFTGTQTTGSADWAYGSTMNFLGCNSANSSGTFNTSGASVTIQGLKVQYNGCWWTMNEETCKTPSPIASANGAWAPGKPETLTLTGGQSNERYLNIQLNGGCAFRRAEEYGSQKCEVLKAQEALVTHEVVCRGREFIDTYGNDVGFELSEQLKLANGERWYLA